MRTVFLRRIFGVFLLMILCLPIPAFSAEYIFPSAEKRECIAYVRINRWNASKQFSYLVKQDDINEVYAMLEMGNQYATKTIEKVDADGFIQIDCMNQDGQKVCPSIYWDSQKGAFTKKWDNDFENPYGNLHEIYRLTPKQAEEIEHRLNMLLLDKKIYSNPRNGEKFLWNPQTPTMKFIEGKIWEYREHAPYFSDDGRFMLPMTELSDFLRDYGYWGDPQLRYDTVKRKVYAWCVKEWLEVPELRVEEKNGVIYVEARNLLEFLGYEVVWDADLKNILVYDRRLFPYEL